MHDLCRCRSIIGPARPAEFHRSTTTFLQTGWSITKKVLHARHAHHSALVPPMFPPEVRSCSSPPTVSEFKVLPPSSTRHLGWLYCPQHLCPLPRQINTKTHLFMLWVEYRWWNGQLELSLVALCGATDFFHVSTLYVNRGFWCEGYPTL